MSRGQAPGHRVRPRAKRAAAATADAPSPSLHLTGAGRAPPPPSAIRVVGAREHNLRDVSVDIPRDELSSSRACPGSGKSSLAFDTLYAEGQRRYVESLSAYARQFLGQMDKPDVDHIEGLSPAISIDQKTTSRNPRSTVATVTEIYDYLRLLYARVGQPHCPVCGRPITGQSVEQIADQVLALPEGDPVPGAGAAGARPQGRAPRRARAGPGRGLHARGRRRRDVRCSTRSRALDKKFAHTIEVVVDRLVMRDDLRRRLTDSLETATRALRRPGAHRGGPARRRRAALVDLLRALRLPGARRVAARAGAAHLLVQLAPRRVPAVHRPRVHARGRPRAGGRPGAHASARARCCPGPTAPPTTTTCCCDVIADQHGDRPRPAVAQRCPSASATCCWRAPGRPRADVPGAAAQGRRELGLVRGRPPAAAAPARDLDVPGGARHRSSSSCRCGPCPACGGARLQARRRSRSRWRGRNIYEVCLLSVADALRLLRRRWS